MRRNGGYVEEYKMNFFTIGEIARLFHMNIRTLRYYDERGILKPAYINEKTKYRYYATSQFERLNTIKYLRALDVPIEEIINFFMEKEVSAMLDIFKLQRERVLEKQRQLARIEKKISNRIGQIESALSAVYGEIHVRYLPQREIVLLKKKFTFADDFEPLIRDLCKEHCLDNLVFLGKVGVSVSQEHLQARVFTYFSAIFLILEHEDDFSCGDTLLPAGQYVTIQYQGTHEEAFGYYQLLLDYIENNGLSLAGDSIEITMIDGGMTNDRRKFVTELQIPVR